MINARFDAINIMILNGKLTEASLELKALAPKTPVEHRIKGHFEGVIAFHRGDFTGARQIFESTLNQHGENIALLRDLTACLYHLQEMLACRSYLDRLERVLIEQESLLNQRSALECEIMLGKFSEEEARLAPALIFYERALQRAQKPEHRLRVLIQKARWLALYEATPELSSIYRELISFPVNKLTQDLQIELEHSLSLVELRLIGADHAWERILRLGPQIPVIDYRLMVFDFIEGSLTQELTIPQTVLEIMDLFQDLDPFEQFLRKLVKESLEHSAKLQELSSLAPKLPWATYLRLLCLCANLETNAPAKQELNRKIQLIIRGLDPRSQGIWNQRLKHALQNPEIRLEFSARLRSVAMQGKLVDLSKKKIGCQILSALLVSNPMSVDDAIRTLWQSSFSPEHYHRLRMSVHRLNALVFEATGLGKVIEVDSQELRLRPEIRLVNADHTLDSPFLNI